MKNLVKSFKIPGSKPTLWKMTDRKAHSKMVEDAWAKFDIKVWPGVGYVSDRKLISQFTGEDEAKLGGFPDNSPDSMVNAQSVNKSWKNLLSSLYKFLNQQKRSGKKSSGFKSPFENLSQEKIQNSINLHPKSMEAIVATNGGHTNYLSCGLMS